MASAAYGDEVLSDVRAALSMMLEMVQLHDPLIVRIPHAAVPFADPAGVVIPLVHFLLNRLRDVAVVQVASPSPLPSLPTL